MRVHFRRPATPQKRSRWVPWSKAAGIGSGALSSAGSAAVAFVGASVAAAVLSSAGVGAASLATSSTAPAVFSSAGAGTSSGVGASTRAASASVAGTGAASFVGIGLSTQSGVQASAGVGSAAFVGADAADAPTFNDALHEDEGMDFYNQAIDVTPSDTVDTFAESSRCFDALYVGGAGNVVVVGENNKLATFVGVPASRIIPVRGKRVNSTNTTASNIVALRKG